MSAGSAARQGTPDLVRRPLLALGAMLAVQACATLTLTAPSVLAPVVAPMIDLAPERIGIFVGICYLSAMFCGLFTPGLVARLGPMNCSSLALMLCAGGLALGATGMVPAMVASAVCIGLAYGIPNPIAALVIGVHAPADRRGLFFSLKQTGVPMGVGLAGLIVPAMLGVLTWRSSLLALAAMCVALAVTVRSASSLDAAARTEIRPEAGAGVRLLRMFSPLVTVMKHPVLRRLGFVSLALSFTQLCFTTFLVSYLKLERDYSLAAAAGVLAATQIVSMSGRVLWGHVGDRWIAPGTLLGALALSAAVGLVLLGLLPLDPPIWLAFLAAGACAATTMSWNGLYYAELVRVAPKGEITVMTGGTQFMTFAGAMSGPVVFAALISLTGSYSWAYIALVPVPLATGIWMLTARSD